MIRRSLCFPWNQWWGQYALAWCWSCSQCWDVCCVSSCQLIWLPWIFAVEDRDVPKPYEQHVPLLHSSHWLAPSGHGPVAPNDSVRFRPLVKRTCFQPKFSKTSGCKDQQHPPWASASAHMYFAKHWLQEQAGLGGAGNSTQNLNCYECITIFKKIILN